MMFQKPRLVVAALKGGSGKTVVSLGLIAALRKSRGLRIVPFKKGPDYIDAGWLARAAGRPCYNLDPFLMGSDEILTSFMQRSLKGDGSIIEGNRGLYDGLDADGSCSTAELAKLLHAPVILVLEATKVTRTAAALVLGCLHLDPDVSISGVVLNQVAGMRHETVLRDAIEKYTGVPVLGVVPKERGKSFFPERHMGLVPPQEHGRFQDAVDYAAERMEQYLDLGRIWEIAGKAAPLGWPVASSAVDPGVKVFDPVVIGIVRDAAFQFYYPENLEALARRGAVLKEISSLESRPLPPVDGLYIGGGFPETHLEVLAGNEVFRDSLRQAIEAGLPVYAECGGLMFLCRGIRSGSNLYPMVGLFPFDVVLERKPQGHGYTVQECVGDNPFFPKGIVIRGHEFHYSRIVGIDGTGPSLPFVFRMQKGHGIVTGWDGICYRNTLACYSHIHAVGNDHWAEAVIRAALRHRHETLQGAGDPKANRKLDVPGVCQYLTAS